MKLTSCSALVFRMQWSTFEGLRRTEGVKSTVKPQIRHGYVICDPKNISQEDMDGMSNVNTCGHQHMQEMNKPRGSFALRFTYLRDSMRPQCFRDQMDHPGGRWMVSFSTSFDCYNFPFFSRASRSLARYIVENLEAQGAESAQRFNSKSNGN